MARVGYRGVKRLFQTVAGCSLAALVAGCFCQFPLGSDDMRTYDEQLEVWREDRNPHGRTCESSIPTRPAADCVGKGVLILAEFTGFTSGTRYYDEQTRELIGAKWGSDFSLFGICEGATTGGRVPRCPDSVVTEVICGTIYDLGEHFRQ